MWLIHPSMNKKVYQTLVESHFRSEFRSDFRELRVACRLVNKAFAHDPLSRKLCGGRTWWWTFPLRTSFSLSFNLVASVREKSSRSVTWFSFSFQKRKILWEKLKLGKFFGDRWGNFRETVVKTFSGIYSRAEIKKVSLKKLLEVLPPELI